MTKGNLLKRKADEADIELARPAWTKTAKKINVNRIAGNGPVEDRRHMVHWDEQLKPIIESVFNSMKAHFATEAQLCAALKQNGVEKWTGLGSTSEKIMARVAKEINSARNNLVPDRADINQAIEKVRASIRKFLAAINEDAAKEFIERPSKANHNRMNLYKEKAIALINIASGGTPITDQIREINAQVLEMIRGCESPCDLVALVHDLIFSITFDLSGKARRDQTEKMLMWHRTMLSNDHAKVEDRYREMLTILD